MNKQKYIDPEVYYDDYKDYSYPAREEIFHQACEAGDINLMRFFLTYDKLETIHIKSCDELAFILACSGGCLEAVEYLLTSPELEEHSDIHALDDKGLIEAASLGHLDIVQYLLTSPELKEHANIHAQKDQALEWACWQGHYEVVKYLLTSPDLKEPANHADRDFINAARNEHLDIIQYFVFDINFKKSDQIEKYLSDKPNVTIENFFKIREVNNKLKVSLPLQSELKKTLKL